jgi:hypothetical protein
VCLHILLFNPFWVDFCIFFNIRIQYHSSARGYSNFLTFIDGIVLLHCILDAFCWKPIDYKYIGLILSSLACSIDWYSYFCASIMHLSLS